MISVLVADDSFLMRKLLTDLLNADPEIEVVGTAYDGEKVIEAARELKPDVITMDVGMPKVDGLAATRRIMRGVSPPAVIILSAFTKDKADLTLECLRSGAFDCLLKPSGQISLDIQKVGHQLCEKVKAAARAKSGLRRSSRIKVVKREKSSAAGRPLVLIGASTGGPPVLEELFSRLTVPPSAAIVVVQHMPEPFTASLAERLDRVSGMKVRESRDGDEVKTGIALVARGGKHVVLEKRGTEYVLRESDAPAVHGMRPSIDVLMSSVARIYDGRLVGILLTGMGEDGQAGMRDLKDRGGHIIVQDPDTCVVDSMVRALVDEHAADEILRPEELADHLLAATRI